MLLAADAVVLDIDGVVCLGDEPLPGVRGLVDALDRDQIALVLATNDSRRDRREQVSRVSEAGVPDAQTRLVTATDALILTLRRDGHRSVAAVGTVGLSRDLQEAGISIDAGAPTALVTGCVPDLEAGREAAVATAELHRELPWYATNDDAFVPGGDGPLPDTGAVLEVMSARTGGRPFVCGKPSGQMTAATRPLLGTDQRVVVIGDGVDTDLAWARAAGWGAVHIGVDCSHERVGSVGCVPALADVAELLT